MPLIPTPFHLISLSSLLHLILHPYSQVLRAWATSGIPWLTVTPVWHFGLESMGKGNVVWTQPETATQIVKHIHLCTQWSFSKPGYGLCVLDTWHDLQRSGPSIKRSYISWTSYQNFFNCNVYPTSFNFYKDIVIQFLKCAVQMKDVKCCGTVPALSKPGCVKNITSYEENAIFPFSLALMWSLGKLPRLPQLPCLLGPFQQLHWSCKRHDWSAAEVFPTHMESVPWVCPVPGNACLRADANYFCTKYCNSACKDMKASPKGLRKEISY